MWVFAFAARLVRAAQFSLRAIVSLWLRIWNECNAAQRLVIGFGSYVFFGVLLLSLPVSQSRGVAFLDNLFNVTSAMSTTGLTTVDVATNYTWFGEFVLLCTFQLGGIGYMTISSFLLLARGRKLSDTRLGVLRGEFALPQEFEIPQFIRSVIVFTFAIEVIGTALLYWEFRAAGVASPLWSAVFHCVSAFATAGFSLNSTSLEAFRGNGVVCATIGLLSYLGAIGFIVIQDAWRAARRPDYDITFTSKVILGMTASILVIGTPLLFFTDALLAELPLRERLYAAAFQVMTASSTAGFNTVPISGMQASSLVLITMAMIIGASPSGTGGGLKTTSLSSLLAVLLSTLGGRSTVTFWSHEIPMRRILTATAAATLYLCCLAIGVFLLCLVENHAFLPVVFEIASGLGTVGLSLGITAELSAAGKLLVTALMFVGRVGPLTIGLAFLQRREANAAARVADLAV